ncbi:antibiotic biosynthesis monooxygenase [Mycobacterium sp. NPDC050551]|uniref:antibiotic biosynthesis monooxygenase family protein n=1 Tax=Mycobacterium sp. NPDC050551 TaxID=3155407 RepID=UPI00342F7A36
MTVIAVHNPYVTMINTFTVEPERAQALADLLSEATDTVMRHRHGFRAANIHISNDRTRVVNYAQWDSEEAYHQMLADPAAREHMGGAAAIATAFDPHLYTVVHVQGPAGSAAAGLC